MYASISPTRLMKVVLLPDWARRTMEGTKSVTPQILHLYLENCLRTLIDTSIYVRRTESKSFSKPFRYTLWINMTDKDPPICKILNKKEFIYQ
jgi:hypothetical protein